MGILKNSSRRERKLVGLATRSEILSTFLSALLKEWGHEVLNTPDPAALLLAEEDCIAGKGWSDILRLGPTRDEREESLDFPLTPERLWRTLETRFFKPPRSHIRINLDLPVKLKVRDQALGATLISLSDYGCRVDLPFELVKEEELLLQLRLRNKTLLIQGKIFYVIQSNKTRESQVGIQFQRVVPENSQALRDFIITEYLLRVRKQVPGWLFSEGLTFFDLSPGVLGALRATT